MKIHSVYLALVMFLNLNGALYEKEDLTIREDHTVWKGEEYKGVTDFVAKRVMRTVNVESDNSYYDVRMAGGVGFTGTGSVHAGYIDHEVVIVENNDAHYLLNLATGELKEAGFVYSFEDRKELTVLDCNDFVLFSDGSVWELDDELEEICATGDTFIIKGAYQKGSPFMTTRPVEWNGRELEMELLGWVDEKATFTDTASYVVQEQMEGEETEQYYGHIARLSNGIVTALFNKEPYPVASGKEVGVGVLRNNLICLTDPMQQRILTKGARIGQMDEKITRTVTEITEDSYIFDDGFEVPRTLNLHTDEINFEMGDVNISIQYNLMEPMKLQFLVKGDQNQVIGSIDLTEKVLCHFDINWDDEKGCVDFMGSRELLEMLIPQNLQVGDTVSGYKFLVEAMGNHELFLFIKK